MNGIVSLTRIINAVREVRLRLIIRVIDVNMFTASGTLSSSIKVEIPREAYVCTNNLFCSHEKIKQALMHATSRTEQSWVYFCKIINNIKCVYFSEIEWFGIILCLCSNLKNVKLFNPKFSFNVHIHQPIPKRYFPSRCYP